jgi:Zn/Cd-binding protein ZinT
LNLGRTPWRSMPNAKKSSSNIHSYIKMATIQKKPLKTSHFAIFCRNPTFQYVLPK